MIWSAVLRLQQNTMFSTPATTNIITEQNIKEAGYKNVFDAIEHHVGLTSTGYGDAGQDFGFSSGRTVIRGYDRGTLVMVCLLYTSRCV